MTSSQTPLGREPAALVGLIEAVLSILLVFGLGISQGTFGPIMAVVVAAAGVYTAWATKDTMLGVIVGLSKAVLILAAVYGLSLSDAQTGALIGLVTLVIGFFQRTQTSPVLSPSAPLTLSPQPVVLTNASGHPVDGSLPSAPPLVG